MGPIEMLRNSGRRLAVVMCPDLGVPMVYVLHRIGSPEFLRLAVAALGAVQATAAQEDELRIRLLGATDDASRERITREVTASNVTAALTANPDGVAQMMSQVDALVMSSVIAIGIGRTDVEIPMGLLPLGTPAKDVCRDLAEPSESWFRPVRWNGPGDAQADGLTTGDMHESERMTLASIIAEAYAPTKAASFPAGPGAPGAGGSVGPSVQPPAKRARAVRRPDGGGDRSGSDAGG